VKKTIITALLLLAPVAAATPEPRVNVESIEPSSVAPGNSFEVDLVVANDGDSAASFGPVSVETVEGVQYRGTTSTLDGSFTLGDSSQQIGTLYMSTSDSLSSGSYPVEIEVPVDGASYFETATINVDGSASLVSSFSSAEIEQGRSGEVSVTVENSGTDAASAPSLSFSSDEVFFSPSSVSLREIPAGESVTRTFNVTPDESLSSGTRQVTGTVEYLEDSEAETAEVQGTVTVLDRAEMALDSLDLENPVVGQESELSVELENLGPGEAESITIEVSCDGADVGSSRTFVGQVDADESVPAVFPVTPTSEDVSCTASVSYVDSEERSLSQSAGFSASTPPPVPPAAVAVVVVLVLVGAGVWYRRRSRDELEEV
jgi:CARDB.